MLCSFFFFFFPANPPYFLAFFVCSAAVTIISSLFSSPALPVPYLCLTIIYFLSYCLLILIFWGLSLPPNHSQSQPLCSHTPPPPPPAAPLPPSHLFPWPWSMRVNASTLLPIISRTHPSDCPPPPDFCCLLFRRLARAISPFTVRQNPTVLNRQRASWSVYYLPLNVCVCVCPRCLFGASGIRA